MLLRRVIEHVKAQNWTAVAIDFLIVVVGVFIGIQVSNWNDARGERGAESKYLVSLEQDMRESISEIDDVIRQIRTHDEAREVLFFYSLGQRPNIEPAELSRLIHGAMWSFASLELRVTTFDTLRNSGRLGILADAEMVTALQDLAALIDEAEFEEQFEVHALERFTDPFLYNNVDMADALTTPSISTGIVYVPWLEANESASEPPNGLDSLQFRNGLIFRSASANERIDSLESIRNKSLEISALIKKRQEVLGKT